MAEDQEKEVNAALGETLALPTAADMTRNVDEEHREIGRRARRMAQACLAGQAVNPAVLQALGVQGRIYFFGLLRSGIASQLAVATAELAKEPPVLSTRANSSKSVLSVSKGWTVQQVERSSYGVRAYRVGGICALALTVLAVCISHLLPEHTSASPILQTLEGLFHGLQ